ncbi:MAG: hypothetical protein HY510_08325, partial [Acidobacteria bacterium]|nr:hypothetical protein [Acidobacteriota bacterium]
MGVQGRGRLSRVLSGTVALLVLAVVARLVLAAGTLTLYVDDDSACASGCGSAAAPHRTIAAAITDANNRIVAGEAATVIIQVAAGLYPERILIVPNVHVRCASPATTTIDASGLGRSAVIFASGGTGRPRRDFSIDGCRITGGMGENR